MPIPFRENLQDEPFRVIPFSSEEKGIKGMRSSFVN